MKATLRRVLVLFVFILISFQLFGQAEAERQWPGFRGYMASGVLDNANLPESFDLNKMTNIRWKTEIPGLGLSSPVIWEDKLFITTAISQADKSGFKPGLYGDVEPVNDSSVHEWKVICLDKNSGKTIWDRTSYKGIPKMKRILNRHMPILLLLPMANMLLLSSDQRDSSAMI